MPNSSEKYIVSFALACSHTSTAAATTVSLSVEDFSSSKKNLLRCKKIAEKRAVDKVEGREGFYILTLVVQ
jgi:hypothetical protein